MAKKKEEEASAAAEAVVEEAPEPEPEPEPEPKAKPKAKPEPEVEVPRELLHIELGDPVDPKLVKSLMNRPIGASPRRHHPYKWRVDILDPELTGKADVRYLRLDMVKPKGTKAFYWNGHPTKLHLLEVEIDGKPAHLLRGERVDLPPVMQARYSQYMDKRLFTREALDHIPRTKSRRPAPKVEEEKAPAGTS